MLEVEVRLVVDTKNRNGWVDWTRWQDWSEPAARFACWNCAASCCVRWDMMVSVVLLHIGFVRKPCCSSGWGSSMRPQDQVCKCFVHESDISNDLAVRRVSCVLCFWKHLEKSFLPTRWNLPCVQNLIHDAQESCHNIVLSGRKVQHFSHQPTLVRSFVRF